MTVEAQDSEFRHPDVVAFLESLTDEQTAKQPPYDSRAERRCGAAKARGRLDPGVRRSHAAGRAPERPVRGRSGGGQRSTPDPKSPARKFSPDVKVIFILYR